MKGNLSRSLLSSSNVLRFGTFDLAAFTVRASYMTDVSWLCYAFLCSKTGRMCREKGRQLKEESLNLGKGADRWVRVAAAPALSDNSAQTGDLDEHLQCT